MSTDGYDLPHESVARIFHRAVESQVEAERKVKRIIREEITAFPIELLPPTYAGISIYRSIVVCWDGDHDPRILAFIDNLAEWIRSDLIACHESKGSLTLLWDGPVHPHYAEGESIEVAGDCWTIEESRSLTEGGAR